MNYYTKNRYDNLPQFISADHEIINSPLYIRHEKGKTKSELYVIKFTLSGSGIIIKDGREFKINKGQGFIWEIGDESISYKFPKDAETPWEFFWFHFRSKMGKSLVEEIIHQKGAHFELPLDDKALVKIINFIDKSIKTQDIDIEATYGSNIINSFLESIIYRHNSVVENKNDLTISDKAKKYIKDNIKKDITVIDIANYLQISREHLTRVFSYALGVTPSFFIKQEKLELGKYLLLTTDQTVKEICFNIGIYNTDRFRNIFKQEFGFTPTSYREIKKH
ncbi:MAG: AraC family transcriptional regulator [Spirochaetaceae bacterium]